MLEDTIRFSINLNNIDIEPYRNLYHGAPVSILSPFLSTVMANIAHNFESMAAKIARLEAEVTYLNRLHLNELIHKKGLPWELFVVRADNYEEVNNLVMKCNHASSIS